MTQPLSPHAILVFDWGSTLMKVFPQYDGPMSEWPEVAEVEGVYEALTALQGKFAMVVATNAADSDATRVWEALRRVRLGGFFKAVFTSQEMAGARKPELAFYRQLETVLDRPAHSLLMIGDDYRVDILGAKAAGWRALWYNPAFQAAPGALPLQDGEISDMSRLPAAIEHLTLPDYPTCLAWLAQEGTPYNITAHVHLTAAVAYQLAVWLAAAGETVDPVLTHRGALMHDLGKYASILAKKERGSEGDHADLARAMLIGRGQPSLAQIADRHMIYADPESPRRPITWEEKLVHFADKLAEGTELVSIEERVAALQRRYPAFSGEMQAGITLLTALQEEICARLDLRPEELVDRLRAALGQQRF